MLCSALQARANRGILYVDEVNLLDDGLVDVVLDSSASGVNTVEREGVGIIHPAKFIMIGSGNPQVSTAFFLKALLLPTATSVSWCSGREHRLERNATAPQSCLSLHVERRSWPGCPDNVRINFILYGRMSSDCHEERHFMICLSGGTGG